MKGILEFIRFMFISAICIFLFYSCITNYNLRYRRYLQEIIDIPQRNIVKEIKLHGTPNLPTTCFHVTLKGAELSEKEALEIASQMATRIDSCMPPEEDRPLMINPMSMFLRVTVVEKGLFQKPMYYIYGETLSKSEGKKGDERWKFRIEMASEDDESFYVK